MYSKTLLNEIKSLPVEERLYLIEQTLKSIRRTKSEKQDILKASRSLKSEYLSNKELTAFTPLDSEGFYEAR
ncbi:MAG: hypothetical protein ABSG15_13285 [FCB group bacterium]|jgi:hypothetical protein